MDTAREYARRRTKGPGGDDKEEREYEGSRLSPDYDEVQWKSDETRVGVRYKASRGQLETGWDMDTARRTSVRQDERKMRMGLESLGMTKGKCTRDVSFGVDHSCRRRTRNRSQRMLHEICFPTPSQVYISAMLRQNRRGVRTVLPRPSPHPYRPYSLCSYPTYSSSTPPSSTPHETASSSVLRVPIRSSVAST